MLSAYLDNELSDAERALVEKHLEEQPDSRRLLAELSGIREAIQTLPRKSLGPNFSSTVMEAVTRLGPASIETQSSEGKSKPWQGRSRGRWIVSLAAIAASLLAALFALDFFPMDSDFAKSNTRSTAAVDREMAPREASEDALDSSRDADDLSVPPMSESADAFVSDSIAILADDASSIADAESATMRQAADAYIPLAAPQSPSAGPPTAPIPAAPRMQRSQPNVVSTERGATNRNLPSRNNESPGDKTLWANPNTSRGLRTLRPALDLEVDPERYAALPAALSDRVGQPGLASVAEVDVKSDQLSFVANGTEQELAKLFSKMRLPVPALTASRLDESISAFSAVPDTGVIGQNSAVSPTRIGPASAGAAQLVSGFRSARKASKADIVRENAGVVRSSPPAAVSASAPNATQRTRGQVMTGNQDGVVAGRSAAPVYSIRVRVRSKAVSEAGQLEDRPTDAPDSQLP